MGDRCYLEMTIRIEDLPKWRELLNDRFCAEEEKYARENHEFFIEMEESEASYSWWDERQSAAKAGCVFYGRHTEGGEYGGGKFVGVDGKHHYVEYSSFLSDVVVSVQWENGKISTNKADLRRIEAFFKALDKAKAVIQPEKHKLKQGELFTP